MCAHVRRDCCSCRSTPACLAAQVDTVLSRLTALKEHIEGTEALIEIDLDHRRNELVSFNLVLHCLSTSSPHDYTSVL